MEGIRLNEGMVGEAGEVNTLIQICSTCLSRREGC